MSEHKTFNQIYIIMRKSILLISTALLFASTAFAQNDGLPPNPQPGKCYIRCITVDEWRDKDVQILARPAYKKLEVVPAVYKDVEETILVKPASKRYEYVPAVFKKVTETIQVEDPYNSITTKAAEFAPSSEEIVYQPAYVSSEWKTSLEGCKSQDPRDCMVLCYVEHKEQKTTVGTQVLKSDAGITKTQKGGKSITITKEEVVTPAQVKEIEIPAEYKTIKKRVLVSDESVREVAVAAEYRTEKVRELVKKGGMTVWEEIDCKLTDPNVLPVFYELGSARLTGESKRIIDQKLYNLMKEKPLIRIEINSHTDSRGTDEANMSLSQARAQSVVDYLISKGIKRDRLVARGYGESKLVNGCKDGVDCTEEQHQQNRRTEFRVLGN